MRGSNKGHQLNIPGIVSVTCRSLGLGSFGAGEVRRQVHHGESERISMIENRNYEKVDAMLKHSHLGLTCFLRVL
jgi:hypothetical protein